MKMMKTVRAFLCLALLVLGGVDRGDVPPMSFDEWRGRQPQVFCEEKAATTSPCGLRNGTGDPGIPEPWFYSGLIVLLLLFAVAAPRDIRRRNRNILHLLAAATWLAVVASHYDRSCNGFVLIVWLIAVVQVSLLLYALCRWIAKRLPVRYGRTCLCVLPLLLASAASTVEFGKRILPMFDIAVSATGRHCPYPADFTPPTAEEREAYERYLWEQRHCTRCGTSLQYDHGWHCPKCHPRGITLKEMEEELERRKRP